MLSYWGAASLRSMKTSANYTRRPHFVAWHSVSPCCNVYEHLHVVPRQKTCSSLYSTRQPWIVLYYVVSWVPTKSDFASIPPKSCAVDALVFWNASLMCIKNCTYPGTSWHAFECAQCCYGSLQICSQLLVQYLWEVLHSWLQWAKNGTLRVPFHHLDDADVPYYSCSRMVGVLCESESRWHNILWILTVNDNIKTTYTRM